MSTRHTLLLRLVGPMQSWGYRSRFDNRDTAQEPTRSGVIGLLCAALGWQRGADLSRFAPLRMGVRVDAAGSVMVDYQTARDVLRASGGVADTTQSWRYYLSDARFLVGLEGSNIDWLKELDCRLRNPIYPLFLGRKSYVPSLPVALPTNGVREDMDLETALQQEPWRYMTWRENYLWEQAQKEQQEVKLRLILEPLEPARGAASNDAPVDFALRRFSLRYVERVNPVLVTETLRKEDELCIFPA